MISNRTKYNEPCRPFSITFPNSLRAALHKQAHLIASHNGFTVDHADVLVACVCHCLNLEAPSRSSSVALESMKGDKVNG